MLSANHLQKLWLSFLLTTPLGNPFKPHQVLLKLRHETKLEHIFILENSARLFKIVLDFLSLVEKLYYLSGKYDIELTVGDITMENSFLLALGNVELDLPEAPEKATRPPLQHALGNIEFARGIREDNMPPLQPVDPYLRFRPKQEMSHIFRASEKRPPKELSYAFLGFTLLLLVGFLFGKLQELEQRLLSRNSGDETAVRAVIEEFSLSVQPDEGSILHKLPTINKCFSKESVEDIITSFEAEASTKGNEWILPVLKGLKRSSPTGLKITLRSIREGRKQTLSECLKKEFRLTINLLRSTISIDVYEGIRALSIEKDNSPKWEPSTLGEVMDEKIDSAFQPFSADLELKIPDEVEISRWEGKYEHSVYPSIKGKH